MTSRDYTIKGAIQKNCGWNYFFDLVELSDSDNGVVYKGEEKNPPRGLFVINGINVVLYPAWEENHFQLDGNENQFRKAVNKLESSLDIKLEAAA